MLMKNLIIWLIVLSRFSYLFVAVIRPDKF